MKDETSAARWAIGEPLHDELQRWAGRKNLGKEFYHLTIDLHYAQALLHIFSRRDIDNPSLQWLVRRLGMLVHDVDVVLSELDYFRVQDKLNGTYYHCDVPPKGCIQRLHFHARHTATALAANFRPSSSSCGTIHTEYGEQASVNLSSGQVQPVKTPKPKFNRVLLSKKMTHTTEAFKPLCDIVSQFLN